MKSLVWAQLRSDVEHYLDEQDFTNYRRLPASATLAPSPAADTLVRRIQISPNGRYVLAEDGAVER